MFADWRHSCSARSHPLDIRLSGRHRPLQGIQFLDDVCPYHCCFQVCTRRTVHMRTTFWFCAGWKWVTGIGCIFSSSFEGHCAHEEGCSACPTLSLYKAYFKRCSCGWSTLLPPHQRMVKRALPWWGTRVQQMGSRPALFCRSTPCKTSVKPVEASWHDSGFSTVGRDVIAQQKLCGHVCNGILHPLQSFPTKNTDVFCSCSTFYGKCS